MGLPAYAFQPDKNAGLKEPAVSPAAKAAPVRKMSADQAGVVQQAEPSGIRAEWCPRLGTPLSIRGPNLGRRQLYSGGQGLALKGGGKYEQDAVAVLDNLARFYRLQDAEKEFAAKPAEADSLGYHHVRLKQVYQGLRVFGGDLIVHFDRSGQAYEVNGQYVPDLQVDVVPRMEAGEAARIAGEDLAAMGKPNGQLEGETALVIFARDAEPQLAYELTLSYDDPSAGRGRWRYWIDAVQGKVLLRYNDIQKIAAPTTNGTNANIVGSILTGEGGQAIFLTVWHENTGYYYLYNTNYCWYVYNAAVSGWPDNNTYANRVTSNWGTSDRVEMSAAKNFALVQRYYLDVHGRNSFDNAGAYLQANVHYGTSYVNAFWDGAAIWIGDGDGMSANSLAVLDVCGHEFTHGVDQYTAGLIYAGESGALNESFSDIMGTCIEFWAEPDGRANYPGKVAGTADWLCGEDCWLSSVALRDLRNPSNVATVGAGNQQPSRYRGTHWDPFGEVHQNDGVQNFFFYLLSEGGSGNNDGIVYNVTGIGETNAEKVAYRALTVYCTPSTGYEAARSAWVSAAMDLNPSWAASAGAAWSAAGVNALFVSPATAMSFRGPVGGPFRPATQTFTLVNQGGESMNWSVTHTQAWMDVAPTNGTIPAGGSNVVSVTINAAANARAMGIYTNFLSFTNNIDPGLQTAQVNLLVGQRDYFTELFDTSVNDLAHQTFTFTPDGSDSFYAMCREPAASFPTDPAGGTAVPMSDDTYAQVTLLGTNTIAIYGRRTNIFYIGSNGYLTMDSGDSTYTESFAAHFDRPRVSALFDDLYPSTGQVTWKQMSNRVAVTYLNVPEWNDSNTNNFQIEMFNDGRIRLTYLQIDATDGLAGLSAGYGIPAGFIESDFSAYEQCFSLSLNLPASATEGSGVLTNAGTVWIGSVLPTNLVVSLSSSVPSRLTVPAFTTIAAGQLSSAFDLNVVDNSIQDGSQTVTVTASAPGIGNTSASMLIMDDDIPPQILIQPSSQPVLVGNSSVFNVTASGTPPLSYQWNFNGTNLSGATNTSLTLTNVQSSQAGNYAVLVTNVYGSILSSNAALTVISPGSCTPPPAGLVGWWPGEGDANDVLDFNNGTLMNGVSFVAGEVGQAFSLDGASSYVSIPDSPSLDSLTSSLTIEAWIRVNQFPDGEWTAIVTKGDSSWRLHRYENTSRLSFDTDGVVGDELIGYVSVDDGQWHHVAAVYDGANKFLYVDGRLDASCPATGFITQNSYPACIGENAEAPGRIWNGLIDEVSIYNRALTASEIQAIYLAGSGGKCLSSSPVIVSQPTNQTVNVGGTAIFSVTASGTPPLIYQWNFNGTNIAGMTNPSLTLTNVQFSQAGNYSVLVTNAFGSALSSNAVLTVNPPPPCDPAPSGLVSWWPGEGDAYDIVGTNNGTVIAGSVNYTQAEVGLGFNFDGGANRLVISNAPTLNFGSNQDFSIEIWIKPMTAPGNWQDIMTVFSKRLCPDTITQLGYELFLQYGQVVLQMADTLTAYSWHNFGPAGPDLRDGQFHHMAATIQRNSTNGGNLYIDGQVVLTFDPTVCPGSLSNAEPARIGNHPNSEVNCFFKGIIDEPSLYNRALTASEIQAIYNAGSAGKCVPVALVILAQPTNQTVNVGGTANFAVVASGIPPLSYQWSFNGTNIFRATNATLTLTNVQVGQTGDYTVLVTNLFGSILSSNALLVVSPDHFAWGHIPSPRFVNTPFSVVIRAQDLTNGIFTNFTGTAILGTTNGVAITPSVSGNFVQGVWTGAVVISQTASNLVLRADDGLGHFGLANRINVINLPSLEMLRSGNIALYMWPVGYTGFVLETSGNLLPATWVVVPYAPIQIGDEYMLPLDMTRTNGFYRLWFPGP